MLKLSNEFSEYISQVSLNFMSYTHNFVKLAVAEANRQKKIRLDLILLLRLYKEMELTDREKEIIDNHLLQYDYKTDLRRCVYQIVYQISDQASVLVNSMITDNGHKMNRSVLFVYRKYLKVLKQYTDSLLHAMCYNHQLILTNPVDNIKISPTMDFDSDCLIEKNILFVKKRKKDS